MKFKVIDDQYRRGSPHMIESVLEGARFGDGFGNEFGLALERGQLDIHVLSLFASPASVFPHGMTGSIGGFWGGLEIIFELRFNQLD
jgi:hypothetical protein